MNVNHQSEEPPTKRLKTTLVEEAESLETKWAPPVMQAWRDRYKVLDAHGIDESLLLASLDLDSLIFFLQTRNPSGHRWYGHFINKMFETAHLDFR